MNAVGSYEGRVFFDKEVSFILGEGSEVCLYFVFHFSAPHPFCVVSTIEKMVRVADNGIRKEQRRALELGVLFVRS